SLQQTVNFSKTSRETFTQTDSEQITGTTTYGSASRNGIGTETVQIAGNGTMTQTGTSTLTQSGTTSSTLTQLGSFSNLSFSFGTWVSQSRTDITQTLVSSSVSTYTGPGNETMTDQLQSVLTAPYAQLTRTGNGAGVETWIKQYTTTSVSSSVQT